MDVFSLMDKTERINKWDFLREQRKRMKILL